jgi:hypothetical protein
MERLSRVESTKPVGDLPGLDSVGRDTFIGIGWKVVAITVIGTILYAGSVSR